MHYEILVILHVYCIEFNEQLTSLSHGTIAMHHGWAVLQPADDLNAHPCPPHDVTVFCPEGSFCSDARNN